MEGSGKSSLDLKDVFLVIEITFLTIDSVVALNAAEELILLLQHLPKIL